MFVRVPGMLRASAAVTCVARRLTSLLDTSTDTLREAFYQRSLHAARTAPQRWTYSLLPAHKHFDNTSQPVVIATKAVELTSEPYKPAGKWRSTCSCHPRGMLHFCYQSTKLSKWSAPT